MRIVSFNINGVRARPHQVEAVVEQLNPDVIGFKKPKCMTTNFPSKSLSTWAIKWISTAKRPLRRRYVFQTNAVGGAQRLDHGRRRRPETHDHGGLPMADGACSVC